MLLSENEPFDDSFTLRAIICDYFISGCTGKMTSVHYNVNDRHLVTASPMKARNVVRSSYVPLNERNYSLGQDRTANAWWYELTEGGECFNRKYDPGSV